MENLTVFTSFSTGFKAGGFNTSFDYDEATGEPIHDTYEPEKSYTYELGIKSVCMNNRLITNLNVFYIDWYDQQVYQTNPSGVGSGLVNAAHSDSKGIELELRFLATKNLSVWGAYGYTEARYIDYVRDENIYSDNLIPYIPANTLNLGANYTVYINKGIRNATLTVNYQQIGELFWNDANSAYQESYGLLNGRLNFHSKEFDFGIWGKNLLDADYNAYYFESLGNSYTQAGKPVQYGVFVHFNI